MTIGQLLNEKTEKLNKAKIKNPHLEAEILLSYVLDKPREWILAHPEKNLTQAQITSYKLQISKWLKGVPSAYITGYKYFYGYKFNVNRHVLIPRPETELMVDEVVNRYSRIADRGTTIVDVGTGTGCIIISLAKILKSSNIKYLAIDISKPALMTAKENAIIHQVDKNINFFHGNLLMPIIKQKRFTKNDSRITICANLPYLTPNQIKNSPTIQKEPVIALVSGTDGLNHYTKLFKQISKLRVMSYELCVLCEIEPSQKIKIINLAKKYLPGFNTEIKKDLRGHSRLAVLSSKYVSKIPNYKHQVPNKNQIQNSNFQTNL